MIRCASPQVKLCVIVNSWLKLVKYGKKFVNGEISSIWNTEWYLVLASLVFILMNFWLNLEVGCHLVGKFFGAAGYADDIILTAPCRSAMAQMVRICEEFGQKNNLLF